MSKTALLLIDIQNDYFTSFEGAKLPLNNMEQSAVEAGKLLNKFREQQALVVHVRHQFPSADAPFFQLGSTGAETHSSVVPLENEETVVKHQINSFHETNLKEILDRNNIENLVIVGAMSHMCIDAVTRAASDYGYKCSLAHDACATFGQEFNGVTVSAEDVHATYMAALGFAYAEVTSTEELLEKIEL